MKTKFFLKICLTFLFKDDHWVILQRFLIQLFLFPHAKLLFNKIIIIIIIIIEMHNLSWDFEIQTDHLILARWPDFVIVNKKKKENLANSGLCHSGWPQDNTERKQKERWVARPC